MELGSNLALGVGHVVILVTLHCVLESCADGLVVTYGVIGLYLALTELLSHSVAADGCALVVDLLHRELHELVIGLGL